MAAARYLLPLMEVVVTSTRERHPNEVACACQVVVDDGHLGSAVAWTAVAFDNWSRAADASFQQCRVAVAAASVVVDANVDPILMLLPMVVEVIVTT